MKILIKVIAVLMLMILHFKCSKVIHEHEQFLNVSDYCPKIGICDVGTHVMCMHYDPNRKHGPLCTNVQDFTMTPDMAETLLNIINGMRSRLARGLESGTKKFPKAYGLFKLEWDPELATLAQVWANQCIYEKDMCRATKKFSDPGQVIGFVLFTHPEWYPSTDRNRFKYPGYSLEKMNYALINTLEFWYKSRKSIDPDLVLGNRKWNANLLGNRYLQMVQGSATHMGCGTAVFRKIRMNPKKKVGEIYNWFVLICNFSTRLRGEELYVTKMPEGSEFTKKCGCPPGYGEDPDCLCYRIVKENPIYCKNGQCKAKLVILPIFTVENAPSHNLTEKRSELESKTKLRNENILNIGLRSVKRFKQSLFSKTPTFVLPSRKLLENSEILNNTNTYLTVNFGTESTYDKITTKFQENSIFLNQEDLKRYERRHNNDFIGIQSSVQSLDANLSDSKSNENIVNLLTEIEIVAKNTKLNKTQKDIFGKKIQYIYKLFLEKTKYLPTKKTVPKDINSLDYEQDKLFKFEDQIKTMKEYDNIYEPINEDENFANTYNTKKEHTHGLKDRKTLNFVNIRNSRTLKNNIKNKINKNIDSMSMEDDLLPFNKRQYYQNKLNNLERKIRQMQSLSRRKYVFDGAEMEGTIPDVPTMINWR